MAQKTVRWFLFFFLPMRSTATGNVKQRCRQLWATADSPEEEGGWGSQRLAGAYAPPCVMGRSAYDDANCNSCALWSFVLSFATVLQFFSTLPRRAVLSCSGGVDSVSYELSKLAFEAQIRQPFSHGDTCSNENSSACSSSWSLLLQINGTATNSRHVKKKVKKRWSGLV